MFQAIRNLFARRRVKQPSMRPFEQVWVDTMPMPSAAERLAPGGNVKRDAYYAKPIAPPPMPPVAPARRERPMSLQPGSPDDASWPMRSSVLFDTSPHYARIDTEERKPDLPRTGGGDAGGGGATGSWTEDSRGSDGDSGGSSGDSSSSD